MNINITGKNIDLTEAIKSYIEEKLHKLDRYLSEIEPVEASAKIESNKGRGERWQKIEVTLSIPRLVIRAEEWGEDLYGAIDIVQEKLERKLRDNKERILELRKEVKKEDIAAYGHADPKDLRKIMKRKKFDLGTPIYEYDAIDRMELLGHDFYVFMDAASGSQKTVYRRNDGGYGVIEAE